MAGQTLRVCLGVSLIDDQLVSERHVLNWCQGWFTVARVILGIQSLLGRPL